MCIPINATQLHHHFVIVHWVRSEANGGHYSTLQLCKPSTFIRMATLSRLYTCDCMYAYTNLALSNWNSRKTHTVPGTSSSYMHSVGATPRHAPSACIHILYVRTSSLCTCMCVCVCVCVCVYVYSIRHARFAYTHEPYYSEISVHVQSCTCHVLYLGRDLHKTDDSWIVERKELLGKRKSVVFFITHIQCVHACMTIIIRSRHHPRLAQSQTHKRPIDSLLSYVHAHHAHVYFFYLSHQPSLFRRN